MDFSQALLEAKSGKSITRKGWNGKGMSVSIQMPDEDSKMTRPYLYMLIPSGSTRQFGSLDCDGTNTLAQRVPWLVSQTDLMAEDWEIA